MQITKKTFPLLCVLVICLSFCKKKKTEEPEENGTSFNKQGMLQNMADGVILPNYISFTTSLDSLIESYSVFKTSFSSEDFKTLKAKYHIAYLNYQQISIFEFGPAEQEMVRMHFNIFPTDSTQIKSNILSGSYNLAASTNMDAKGFPALDYLLFNVNMPEAQIIQSFSMSPNKQQYVSDVLNDMKQKISSVLSGWNTTYKTTFINSLSLDIGSSIGSLVNQINFELDYLKNYKIGIPLGKKTLGVSLPGSCEAYHEGNSIEYALSSLRAIENAYTGKSRNDINGLGLDDYLDHLNATYAGGSLNAAILQQFTIARTKLTALNGRLSTQIKTNPSPVNEAYIELVKLLVLLKTDLPSNLGVVINYQDGDGD